MIARCGTQGNEETPHGWEGGIGCLRRRCRAKNILFPRYNDLWTPIGQKSNFTYGIERECQQNAKYAAESTFWSSVGAQDSLLQVTERTGDDGVV